MAIGGKPFSLQAPEQIAKEYGGDKQKIMQAAQMGVVDPTAAVMAGMFIDRMRTAQAAEQAAPPTVAQEVFAPPAPPPMQGAPGMGAPPMVPPQMAPQAGGLEALPVSDAMFSEGEVGMAGGGMVSFAGGGPLGSWFEEQAAAAVPGVQVTSGMRSAADNARVGGAANSYHLTDNARDFVPPEGVSMAQLEASLRNRLGAGYDVINEGDHVHIEPGPQGGGTRASAPASSNRFPVSLEDFMAATETPEVDYAGNIASMQERLAGILPDTSAIDEMMTSLRERSAPEEVKEQREQDLWGALADFGFRWASSGNLAESAGETFSGLRETIEGRREQEFEDLTRMIQLEGMNIERAMVPVTMGIDAAQKEAGLASEQSGRRATFLTQLGSTGLAGEQRMAEAEQEAQLNPPTAEGAITPAAMRSAQDAARSDISEYISMGVDPNSGITPGDPQLVAVVRRFAPNGGALTTEQFAAAVNALAAVRLGGAPAGAGAGAVSVPWVAPQGAGNGDPALRWIPGQ